MSDMSNLPMDAIVACDAEVERLRARVAELEESIRFNEDQRRMLFDASTKLEAERDSWKTEALAWRNKERTTEESLDILLKHGPRSKQDKDSIRAMCDARDALKAARAANERGEG